MRKERKLLKALAAALTTAMAFQSAALAAPMDELNDILEKQQEIESDLDVALEEQLGLTELGEAVEENGVRFVIDLEPGDKALTDPSLLDVLPEESYYHGNLQVDKNLKKWLLESGVGTAENALLDFSLYGDEQKLAISIPQFFEGAISIEAGSFLDQYNGSVLKELIESFGGDALSGVEIPDFDLFFWPKEGENEEDALLNGNGNDLENKVLAIAEKTDVEKLEEEGETIYRMTIATADIADLYKEILNQYANVFSALATLDSSSNIDEMPEKLDQMIDEMAAMLGDTISLDFHVNELIMRSFSRIPVSL